MKDALAWPKVAEGINLVGIGCFLLATTMGVLPWSFWGDALALWPVLIIAVGIRVAFERTRAPWLVLLSPVLILGSLWWIAQAPRVEAPVSEWVARSAERPKEAEAYTFEAHLARARFDLEARELKEGLLVDGRTGFRRERGSLEVRGDDREPRIRISTGNLQGWSVISGTRQRWELGLSEALPLRLEIRGAMNRGRAALGRAHLSEARVEGAFNDIAFELPRPEALVPLRFRGAFNNLRIVVPRGTVVRVRRDGPFNVIERDRATASGGTSDGPGYELRVDGAFNHVSVNEG
jgi:hypothetical protein